MRVARRDFDQARRVPAELVEELAHASATGHEAWLRAREDSDFALFEPPCGATSSCAGAGSRASPRPSGPYDALLDDYEPEMRTAAGRGRPRAAARRPRAARRGRPRRPTTTRSCTAGPFPVDAQRRARRDDPAAGRRRRPPVAPRRRRPPVRRHGLARRRAAHDALRRGRPRLDLLARCTSSATACTRRTSTAALARSPLGTGVSSAVHESQSRLWENMVGRSPGFWRWCFPHLRARCRSASATARGRTSTAR